MREALILLSLASSLYFAIAILIGMIDALNKIPGGGTKPVHSLSFIASAVFFFYSYNAWGWLLRDFS